MARGYNSRKNVYNSVQVMLERPVYARFAVSTNSIRLKRASLYSIFRERKTCASVFTVCLSVDFLLKANEVPEEVGLDSLR